MRRFRDTDGDVWYEGSDGRLYDSENDVLKGEGFATTKDVVEANWGPLTELSSSPTNLSAPAPAHVTRAELAGALQEVASNYGCTGTELHNAISDALYALADKFGETK